MKIINYKKGIIQGLELFEKEPSLEEIEKFLDFIRSEELVKGWKSICKNYTEIFVFDLKAYLVENNLDDKLDFVTDYLIGKCYRNSEELSVEEVKEYLRVFLNDVLKDNKNKFSLRDKILKGVI